MSVHHTAGQDVPDDARRLLDELLLEKYEPIAVVGVGMRFPGDNNTWAQLEDSLRAGRSCTGPVPVDRWNAEEYLTLGDEKGKIRTAGGGFITSIDQFDAKFFSISPKEAQYVDPQHRLVLETSWEALEHAGIDPSDPRCGRGGVYVGVSTSDYVLEAGTLADEELDAYLGTGTAHSAIPGRVSYFLGWQGPSIAVDTACSSSLVALHLATEGLRRRECDIALCAGVNVIHHPRNHIIFSQAKMLSPDGRCKTFDAAADGYSRSDGCGSVALKRLSDAMRDRDRILALVRGSAVRQDGRGAGLTVPNGSAQVTVMRAAMTSAMVSPGEIQYVEAHGTGTPLGDPIEMGAIRTVFAESHSTSDPIVVGSLKTNLGHMESAAGIGGLIKAVLQLHNAEIYPHLNLTNPSTNIPWERYPVTVPTERRRWEAGTRRALVNSFGFAGTIATAVLEQAPARPDRADGPAAGMPHIFCLSAKNGESLRRQTESYRHFLAGRPALPIADICYTSTAGRAHFSERLAGVVRDREELTALLERPAGGGSGDPAGRPGPAKVAFLFTGQGAQYPGMGKLLYARFPSFRDTLDECDALLEPHLGRSIKTMVLGAAADVEEIHQTAYTQPALFALEYATARLWRSWGVTPSVLLGHSIGELVAATVAGVLGLADAAALVAARGRLMQSVRTPGGMVALSLPADEIAPLIRDYPDLSFAAFNAPGQCVIAGGLGSLAAVTKIVDERGARPRALPVSHAFHSPLMDEVSAAFRESIRDITFREPEIAVISNVTGAMAGGGQLSDPEYWVRHIGAPVNFEAGMGAIARRGAHIFIEMGPSPVLLGLGRRCVEAPGNHRWLASMRPGAPDDAVILQALAKAYENGVDVSWNGVHRASAARRTTLPAYAFDRRRYWLPPRGERHAAPRADTTRAHHPLLGAERTATREREGGGREFVAHLDPGHPAYLTDHRVLGKVVFPAAGVVEILLAAQEAVYGETGRPLLDVEISEPLLLSDDQPTELRTRVFPRPGGGAGVEIVSVVGGSAPVIERRHATARIGGDHEQVADPEDIAASLRQVCGTTPSGGRQAADVYADLSARGLDYGPAFRRIERIERHGADAASGVLRGSDTPPAEQLPPFILDAAMQMLVELLDGTRLPVGFERIHLLRKPKGPTLRCLLRRTSQGGTSTALDVVLLDGERLVCVVAGLAVRQVANTGRPARRGMFHETRWRRRSLAARPPRPRPRVLVIHHDPAALAELARDADGTELAFAPDAAAAVTMLAPVPTDVCWFWRHSPEPPDEARLRAEMERNYRELLALLDGLERAGFGRRPRLWLVTQGAQHLPADPASDGAGLAAASLWGFGLSLWAEYPAYSATLVDLPAGATDHRMLLAEWAGAEAEEFQIAYREPGGRHVRRITATDTVTPGAANVELAISAYGEFTNVRPVAVDIPPAPVRDEISVRMHAAGLNFKDALNVLGLLRQDALDRGVTYTPLPLGLEGAGTVVASGPDAEFGVGDEVIVSHPGTMRRLVNVRSPAAVRKPAGLGFAEAAGLPTAYISAYYALHHLAGIKEGDKVLVHAAAGGVGQAAVGLARLAGATVLATASPPKHAFLRAAGIEHIMNSRTLDFADQVLEMTGGEGVDIVLNSLNKEYIPHGLRSLGKGGRFIELGKIGVWSAEQVKDVRPDVAYHSFDLSEFPEDELLPLVHEIMTTVTGFISDGRLRALSTTTYDADEISEAFSVISRGASIGKLVVTFPDEADSARPVVVLPTETYLLTGGLGGLGRSSARELVRRGARHLAFVTRREPPADEVASLTALLGDDVDVTVYRGDIAQRPDVERILAELRASPWPLGGVIHGAGILADTPVASMTWPDIDAVLRPKAYGTWLLHEGLAAFPELRFLAAYSSVAAVVSSAGQANYAAANAFMDAVMTWRAAHGLPGLSINWGPWSEVGMSAALDSRLAASLRHRGMTFLRPSDGTAALVTALSLPRSRILIGEFDWDQVASTIPAVNALYREVAGGGAVAEKHVDIEALLALPRSERSAALRDLTRGMIAKALSFDGIDDIPVDAGFTDIGLDSLVAVEVKNSLEAALRIPLPAAVIFDRPSVGSLVEFLEQQLAPGAQEAR